MIDIAALKGNSTGTGTPSDGIRTARLERAAIVTTRDGRLKLKTEWAGVDRTYWESWDSLERGDQYFDRAKGLVQGILGPDLDTIDSGDELEQALAQAEGRSFEVRTEANPGRDGRVFVNTHFEDQARQQQFATDVPVDVSDMTAAPAIADDDIPF